MIAIEQEEDGRKRLRFVPYVVDFSTERYEPIIE